MCALVVAYCNVQRVHFTVHGSSIQFHKQKLTHVYTFHFLTHTHTYVPYTNIPVNPLIMKECTTKDSLWEFVEGIITDPGHYTIILGQYASDEEAAALPIFHPRAYGEPWWHQHVSEMVASNGVRGQGATRAVEEVIPTLGE